LNERIEVEARLDNEGRLLPRAFTWRGRRYEIVSHGRHWKVREEFHFLVMAPGDRTFELVHSPEASSWRMRRSPGDFGKTRHKA